MRFGTLLGACLVAGGLAAGALTPAMGQAQGSPDSAAEARQRAEETAVGEAFVGVRAALRDRDGAAVLASLSQEDRQRLDRIRAAAGEGKGLSALGPSERFAALGLRHYMKPADIKRRDAAGLAEYALDQRWLDPRDIGRAGLSRVRVQGDRASGTLVIDNKPQIVPANFVKEQGRWKLDLSPTLQMTDALIRTQAGLTRRTEDQVIVEILERASGRKVTASLQ
ncbi:hypothetical protein [Arenibaculum pallidiluteum]|uniref:hypothetical protein n=1 Tax=Arenibaculum pallidiluteum TaxID=2812559 RepID=UPI001A966E7F|nr:hypothetical protein [Arenibaculum pallidiluteum]